MLQKIIDLYLEMRVFEYREMIFFGAKENYFYLKKLRILKWFFIKKWNKNLFLGLIFWLSKKNIKKFFCPNKQDKCGYICKIMGKFPIPLKKIFEIKNL